MTKRSKRSNAELLVVHFLVPKRDREGNPYPRSIHESLRRDLEELFDGWSSLGDEPLPGGWRNPRSGEVEYDESWRYEVGIPGRSLADLDEFLADLSYRLGQKAIWRVIYRGGKGKAIVARSLRKRQRRQRGEQRG